MDLTRAFKDTVLARAEADPKFRAVLLKDGVETLLAGDVETGKSLLRDSIKAALVSISGES